MYSFLQRRDKSVYLLCVIYVWLCDTWARFDMIRFCDMFPPAATSTCGESQAVNLSARREKSGERPTPNAMEFPKTNRSELMSMTHHDTNSGRWLKKPRISYHRKATGVGSSFCLRFSRGFGRVKPNPGFMLFLRTRVQNKPSRNPDSGWIEQNDARWTVYNYLYTYYITIYLPIHDYIYLVYSMYSSICIST